MAVFLLRAEHGPAYAPPPATGTVFGDVPSGAFAAAWIEALAAEGITGGCGGGNYCPTSPVRRDQMAVFLLKAEHGPGYVPPGMREPLPGRRLPVSVRGLDRAAGRRKHHGRLRRRKTTAADRRDAGQMAAFLVIAFPLP